MATPDQDPEELARKIAHLEKEIEDAKEEIEDAKEELRKKGKSAADILMFASDYAANVGLAEDKILLRSLREQQRDAQAAGTVNSHKSDEDTLVEGLKASFEGLRMEDLDVSTQGEITKQEQILITTRSKLLHFFPEEGGKFLVRSCYKPLWDVLKKYLKTTNVVLSGNPGIGKSVYFLYLLHMFSQNELADIKDREESTMSIDSLAYICDRRYVLITKNENGNIATEIYQSEMKLLSAIERMKCHPLYCFDPKSKAIDMVFAPFIILCSPNEGLYKKATSNHNHRQVYMPLWSLDELETARTVLGLAITEEKLKEAFLIAGGTYRACIVQDRMKVCKEISEALIEIQSQDFRVVDVALEKCGGNLVSNKLLHLSITDNTYEKFVVIFGSNYIRKELERLLHRNHLTQMEEIIMRTPNAATSVWRGWIFERYVHFTYPQVAKTLEARSLGEDAKTLKLPETAYHVSFSDLTELNDRALTLPLYCQPTTSSLRAIDAIVITENSSFIGLQMTISPLISASDHEEDATFLSQVQDVSRQDCLDLVFLVPDDEYHQQKMVRQRLKNQPPTEETTLEEMLENNAKRFIIKDLKEICEVAEVEVQRHDGKKKEPLKEDYVRAIKESNEETRNSVREAALSRFGSSLTVKQWVCKYPLSGSQLRSVGP